MAVQSLAVFCGSSMGDNPAFELAAKELGRALADRKVSIIFGGQFGGLMGVLARSALDSGGTVIGVVPRQWHRASAEDSRLSELLVTESIHDRKLEMSERADGFLALPGGSGTLEEILEQWTWSQLELHSKPCAVLNVAGYYDALKVMIREMGMRGFTKPRNLEKLAFYNSTSEVAAWLGNP